MRFKPCNIKFWSEQSYFAIEATICLQAFEQLHGIVKSFGRRMQDKIMNWTYPWFSPATVTSVLHLIDILHVMQLDKAAELSWGLQEETTLLTLFQ